jgi:hypothetical protein
MLPIAEHPFEALLTQRVLWGVQKSGSSFFGSFYMTIPVHSRNDFHLLEDPS